MGTQPGLPEQRYVGGGAGLLLSGELFLGPMYQTILPEPWPRIPEPARPPGGTSASRFRKPEKYPALIHLVSIFRPSLKSVAVPGRQGTRAAVEELGSSTDHAVLRPAVPAPGTSVCTGREGSAFPAGWLQGP